jgi:hypothetical protein
MKPKRAAAILSLQHFSNSAQSRRMTAFISRVTPKDFMIVRQAKLLVGRSILALSLLGLVSCQAPVRRAIPTTPANSGKTASVSPAEQQVRAKTQDDLNNDKRWHALIDQIGGK